VVVTSSQYLLWVGDIARVVPKVLPPALIITTQGLLQEDLTSSFSFTHKCNVALRPEFMLSF
jgi:hypothetical protein